MAELVKEETRREEKLGRMLRAMEGLEPETQRKAVFKLENTPKKPNNQKKKKTQKKPHKKKKQKTTKTKKKTTHNTTPQPQKQKKPTHPNIKTSGRRSWSFSALTNPLEEGTLHWV